jgi:chemotaxis protein methyltransferase CheR
MSDAECVGFLQWALPQLGLRWPGFRKVRRQVHKRLNRRLGELGLAGIADYRAHLETHPEEWPRLDALCRISISRFYRDRSVFDHLRDVLLSALAEAAIARCENQVRCWSIGCASGEEIYTVAILWNERLQSRFPRVRLQAIGTDIDEQMLQRARQAEYPASSLKDLPLGWRETAFTQSGALYILRPEFQRPVEFRQQDIRTGMPAEAFPLVLCRNLVLTYFAEELQRQVIQRIVEHIVPGGFLVVGKHETLPEGMGGLLPHQPDLGVYRSLEPAEQGSR